MKDELMKLSHDKGFRSIEIREDDIYGYIYYYRWLCELQQWLIKKHHVLVLALPIKNGATKLNLKYEYGIYHRLDDLEDYTSSFYEHNTYYNEYEKALENGLKEALQSIN